MDAPLKIPYSFPTMASGVRVRYAPSPTGFLHIGGLRTALYNELFARRNKGTFILRIEDTDRTRYVEGATENLIQSLKACDLTPDEGVIIKPNGSVGEKGDFGPYIQSARQDKHAAYAKQLVETGHAYPCFCTEQDLTKMREEQQAAGLPTRYDRRCRELSPEQAAKRVENEETHVIRLKVPLKGTVTFVDEIRDEISFDWKQVDDQVLIKSDGMPTYHLAATCDDHDMEITHVIRGEEWLASTPKHLFIYEAFGWTPPKFAHLPLLLNSDRSKLSKRQGDVAVEDYLAKGYLPAALLNFVALLGWNPSGEQEIYTHDELRSRFELSKVNKAGAVVNFEKLDWLNGQYLKAMKEEDYLQLAGERLQSLTQDHALIDRMALLVRDRVAKLSDLPELAGPYLGAEADLDPLILPWKTQPPEEAKERLEAVRDLVRDLGHDEWHAPTALEQPIKVLIANKGWGNGDTLWPLRVALSGQKQSPGPFELLYALGRERSLARLDRAITSL
jgi:glutamyl-tRNA synthetase